MPTFAFWNTYRLGSGSDQNKKDLFEGVLQQIFEDHTDLALVSLCEITSGISLGTFSSDDKMLVRATRSGKQLMYSCMDANLGAMDIESASIPDFQDVFGKSSYKKGGGIFTRQSKRPVAYVGQVGGTHVYVYHSNSSAKSAFLVSWVAESLEFETDGKFILAGDLNCEPIAFQTEMTICTGIQNYAVNTFHMADGGHTHNAKKGVSRTLDWAIGGSKVPVTVSAKNYLASIGEMEMEKFNSDHLPIVISWG